MNHIESWGLTTGTSILATLPENGYTASAQLTMTNEWFNAVATRVAASWYRDQVELAGYIESPERYPQEPPVSLKSKQFAVIAVGANQLVGAHDDEAEAVAQASRLAAKHDGEYLVLRPVRLLRQKPVDIEDVAL